MKILVNILFLILSVAGFGQVYDTIPVKLLVSDTLTGRVKVINTKEVRKIEYKQGQKLIDPNTEIQLGNNIYSRTLLSTYFIQVTDTIYTHHKYLANLSNFEIWQKH